jgi:hypothetical protein
MATPQDPKANDTQVQHCQPQPVLSVRATVPVAELTAAQGDALRALWNSLQHQGPTTSRVEGAGRTVLACPTPAASAPRTRPGSGAGHGGQLHPVGPTSLAPPLARSGLPPFPGSKSRAAWCGAFQAERRAMWSRSVPGTPFSSTGPTSVNATGPPSAASTTSWLTTTSPGLAYSPILAARFTVRPK